MLAGMSKRRDVKVLIYTWIDEQPFVGPHCNDTCHTNIPSAEKCPRMNLGGAII